MMFFTPTLHYSHSQQETHHAAGKQTGCGRSTRSTNFFGGACTRSSSFFGGACNIRSRWHLALSSFPNADVGAYTMQRRRPLETPSTRSRIHCFPEQSMNEHLLSSPHVHCTCHHSNYVGACRSCRSINNGTA
eukprot:scaffold10833_cov78-Skeletonema_dohrnii-CCMP3373.AAC.5